MKKKTKRILVNPCVVSSVALSDEQKTKICEGFPTLAGKTVDFAVDKSLIAGFVVRQESDIFDASVSGKINYLLNKIYENIR